MLRHMAVPLHAMGLVHELRHYCHGSLAVGHIYYIIDYLLMGKAGAALLSPVHVSNSGLFVTKIPSVSPNPAEHPHQMGFSH